MKWINFRQSNSSKHPHRIRKSQLIGAPKANIPVQSRTLSPHRKKLTTQTTMFNTTKLTLVSSTQPRQKDHSNSLKLSRFLFSTFNHLASTYSTGIEEVKMSAWQVLLPIGSKWWCKGFQIPSFSCFYRDLPKLVPDHTSSNLSLMANGSALMTSRQ